MNIGPSLRFRRVRVGTETSYPEPKTTIGSSLTTKTQEGRMGRKSNLSSWRWWLGLKDPIVLGEPKKKYGITIMIPAYNEEKSIAETIRGVQAQTVPIDEVIVVDDCSTDRTGEIAASMGVTVIRTETNQGTKATAQKYVLERGYVKTELFITIDGDTLLAPDAVERTLPYFNDPMAGSVCGYVIPARIRSVWERGRFVEYVCSLSLFKMAQNHIGAVMVSSGCFTVFKTDLVRELGGFNTRTMAEDMDLTWELSMRDYRIYCDNNAFCYPYDPPTGKIFVAQLDRWYRSFFQNMAIHWKDLLKRDRKLAAIAMGYMFDGGMFLMILMWAMLYAVIHLTFASLLMALALDTAIVAAFALIEGIRVGRFWQVLVCLPSYQVTRSVTMFVFWRSMWREWVAKDRLNVWVKGH